MDPSPFVCSFHSVTSLLYYPPKKSQRVKAKKMHNSAKEEDTLVKNRNKQMKKMGRINKKLEDAGIDYRFQFAEMSQ